MQNQNKCGSIALLIVYLIIFLKVIFTYETVVHAQTNRNIRNQTLYDLLSGNNFNDK